MIHPSQMLPFEQERVYTAGDSCPVVTMTFDFPRGPAWDFFYTQMHPTIPATNRTTQVISMDAQHRTFKISYRIDDTEVADALEKAMNATGALGAIAR